MLQFANHLQKVAMLCFHRATLRKLFIRWQHTTEKITTDSMNIKESGCEKKNLFFPTCCRSLSMCQRRLCRQKFVFLCKKDQYKEKIIIHRQNPELHVAYNQKKSQRGTIGNQILTNYLNLSNLPNKT